MMMASMIPNIATWIIVSIWRHWSSTPVPYIVPIIGRSVRLYWNSKKIGRSMNSSTSLRNINMFLCVFLRGRNILKKYINMLDYRYVSSIFPVSYFTDINQPFHSLSFHSYSFHSFTFFINPNFLLFTNFLSNIQFTLKRLSVNGRVWNHHDHLPTIKYDGADSFFLSYYQDSEDNVLTSSGRRAREVIQIDIGYMRFIVYSRGMIMIASIIPKISTWILLSVGRQGSCPPVPSVV